MHPGPNRGRTRVPALYERVVRPMVEAVVKRRLISSALVALLTFGVQATYGMPGRAMTGARASWCCSTLCHHGKAVCHHVKPAASAAPCCRMNRGDHDDLTVSSPNQRAEAGLAFYPAFIDLGSPPHDRNSTPRSDGILSPRARAAPLFLLTRSLRI